MALTKDQKELIKWVVWIFGLIGVFVQGQVSKAKMETELVVTVENMQEDIREIKEDGKETKEYALTNKDNITRLTALRVGDSQ